jgi:hypothetical protein
VFAEKKKETGWVYTWHPTRIKFRIYYDRMHEIKEKKRKYYSFYISIISMIEHPLPSSLVYVFVMTQTDVCLQNVDDNDSQIRDK